MLYSPRDELDDLIDRLNDVTKTKGGELIDDFISRSGIDMAIYDQESFKNGGYNDPLDDIGTLTLKTYQDTFKAITGIPENGTLGSFAMTFKDDPTDYLVQYYYYGQTDNLVPRALARSYKLIIAAVVGVSLVSSVVYAYLFARPVRKLSKVSRKMAEMDFTAKCDERRGDEIGDLARDLNILSSTLDSKIRALEDEITRVRELESQKEMFFAAASHELKTPVTVLEGHLRGMIEGIGPYEDHDVYLAKSLRTVKQMESLINEILTASKMQSSSEMVKVSVDMGEVLNRRLDDSEELFLIRNITVEKHIGTGLTFSGNSDLTSLALGAFISNAVFYSVDGAKIDIRCEKEGDKIVTKILNHGAHIDDRDLPHLFEPFYRADPSRTGREAGSGLGLYLAQLIISKQGGSVSLSNEDDGVLAGIILPFT